MTAGFHDFWHMVTQFHLWQNASMTDLLEHRYYNWIFSVVTLGVWLAVGWPALQTFTTDAPLDGSAGSVLWLVLFAFFGAAVLGATVLKLPTRLRWFLLGVQLAAVLTMTIVAPRSTYSIFLVIIAWQVALTTTPIKALGWVAGQTLAMVGALALPPGFDLSYIVALSFVLQLCFVLTARALRMEAQTSSALARTHEELRAAQAIIANNARNAERLRISRELHDAWGHELTALGLQLEIASHLSEPSRENHHVVQARGLASALLSRVREVVAGLRETERHDWRDAPQGVPLSARNEGDAPTEPRSGNVPLAASYGKQHYWFFCVAALAVCLALGSPVFQQLIAGAEIRGMHVSALWLIPFAIFGAAAFSAMVPKLPTSVRWILLGVQVAAVIAMAAIVQWAMMSAFLIITAWQAALMTPPAKALGWVAFQTLAVTAALGLVPNPDICWVIGKSFALQLCFVFAAQALRMEAQTARALAERNMELRSAQAVIANNVRDAERVRISRDLHDAWGHELTALGLQLEIASHVAEPGRSHQHVMQARGLASGLMAKVRDVVATLREPDLCNLKDALEALAQSVPAPSIHIDISPDLRVRPDQAHALMRCAQEAVTNAIRHAQAANLWLRVTADDEGVRLVARDDGMGQVADSSSGSGLLGMRERVEVLGGRLAVEAGAGFGFTIHAWLPSGKLRAA